MLGEEGQSASDRIRRWVFPTISGPKRQAYSRSQTIMGRAIQLMMMIGSVKHDLPFEQQIREQVGGISLPGSQEVLLGSSKLTVYLLVLL